MPGILLIIDLMALGLAVYSLRGQREFLRESMLIGFVLWGSLILMSTETLSPFNGLGFGEIFIFWMMVLVLCAVFIWKNRHHLSLQKIFYPARGPYSPVDIKPWPFLEKTFFNRVVFFSFCLAVVALLSPPNTSDSMTYHMARVMHWIQDHNTAYYPTHIPRQLYYPVLSEYIILHFQILSSGDRWANFVQWLGMGSSLIGVSLIARELGAGRRGQIIAALVTITLFMGVLEATSTQSDYVVSGWLCIFIYFFLCWRRTLRGGYALWAAAGLGLALSTKMYALILAVPFLGWAVIEALSLMNIRRLFMIVLMMAVAVMFYAGSFWRNTVYFHGNATKVLSADADSFMNDKFCWEAFEANVLRNAGLHVITPSYQINQSIKEGIYSIASFLHVDLNNKKWSYVGNKFPAIDFRGNEDYLGNPLHFMLFGIVMVLLLFSPRFRRRDPCFYLTALLAGTIAFNALLKWQPWHSRFHLPMFVIFAPLAGLVIEKIKTRWLVSGIMGTLFISAWIILLVDVSKPILSPMSIFYPQDRDALHFFFADSPQTTYTAYEQIAVILKKMKCKNIGLIMGDCEREYLLWDILDPKADDSMRIESVLVNNPSASLNYPLGNFLPDAIITLGDPRPWVIVGGNIYSEAWSTVIQGKKIGVLLKNQQLGI